MMNNYIWKNILLLFFSIFLSLFIAELSVRFFLPTPQKVIIKQDSYLKKWIAANQKSPRTQKFITNQEEGGLYIYTETGRRLRPNTVCTILNHDLSKRKIEINTNMYGYRNPQIKEKKGTRILFLGDSITFGDFVQESETFVRIIETIATKKNKTWETVNSAVGGASLNDELSILKETGLLINPDVVVVNFYLNDFYESPGVEIRKLPSLFERSRLCYYLYSAIKKITVNQEIELEKLDIENWRNEFKGEHRFNKGDFRIDKGAFNYHILENFRDWGGSFSYHTWEHITPLFEELKRISKENNFKLLITVFPVRHQVEANFINDYPQQQLKKIAKKFNIPVFDLLPILREKDRISNKDIFYDHCHHTPYGNEIIGDEIFNFLNQQI